jgi:hypothetical protein
MPVIVRGQRKGSDVGVVHESYCFFHEEEQGIFVVLLTGGVEGPICLWRE